MASTSNAGAAPISLPRLRCDDPAVQRWADELVRALQTEMQRMGARVGTTGYTLTNFSGSVRGGDPGAVSRSLDPTSATTAQASTVLATLILDLKTKGILL